MELASIWVCCGPSSFLDPAAAATTAAAADSVGNDDNNRGGSPLLGAARKADVSKTESNQKGADADDLDGDDGMESAT